MTNICGSNNPPPCNGSNNPYMSGLANSYGIATQYVDLTGTSQPNYIGIMAATLSGCTSSCGPNTLSETNLVDRFDTAGLGWKAYMEDQTPVAGCDNSDHGFYEIGHNPFVAFHDIDTNSTRCNKIVLANPANNSTCTGTDCALVKDLNSGSAPNFMWLTPNDCNNMHGASGCSDGCISSYTSACTKAGDNYLSGLVPNILNSNTFKNTKAALFMTFDEGNGFCPLNGSGEDCMYTVWAGPVAQTNSFSSSQLRNHYSFTKTIETNWNLATMTSNDASAIAMTDFFSAPSPDFTISATSPTPVNAGQSAASTITVSALHGFTGTISLTDTIPSGLNCGSISPSSITGSGTATVSCSATSAGNYTLTMTGTSGSLIHTATALFQFRDFTIAGSSVTVNAGASGTSTITITAVNRFAGIVTLTDAFPSGLVCGSITPSSLTGSGAATVSCSATASNNYTLTITGTSASLVHTATPIFHVQDFGVAVPSPAPVKVGSSVTSSITISAINHFAGVVSLTDIAPSGLTCGTITPNSVTGSGRATVSCNATVSGNYTLTVTGTNGALSHSATIIISVEDYTITANLANAVINAGTTGSAIITITPLNHFSGTVSLSPTSTTGLTRAINPTSILGGSGTATLTFSSNTAGNYTVTINSSNGTLTHSITLTVQVVDFAIAANPSTVTILAGATGNSTVTITALNRFGGTVSLMLTPSMGLTATIVPSSIAGSGPATMSAGASTSGDYSVTIRATSGSLSHTIGIVIHVLDYSLAGNPTSLIAPIGSSTSSSLTIQSLNGYDGNISLTFTVQPDTPTQSAGGSGGGGHTLILAPPAVTLPSVSISPQSFLLSPSGAQQSTVSISLPPNLPVGDYLITVTASDGTLSHQILLTLAATDFSLTATPNSASLPSGSNSTIVLNLESLNLFQGNVTLTLASQAGGPTGTLSTSTVQLAFNSNVNLNLTINVPSNTAPGNYTITIQATSGTVSHTLVIPVRVTTSGLASILTGILNPSNSMSIGALAIFSLFTIFATPRFRAFCNRKPSTYKRSKIEKRISRRTPSTRFIPCSSSPPLLWRPTSRDEI